MIAKTVTKTLDLVRVFLAALLLLAVLAATAVSAGCSDVQFQGVRMGGEGFIYADTNKGSAGAETGVKVFYDALGDEWVTCPVGTIDVYVEADMSTVDFYFSGAPGEPGSDLDGNGIPDVDLRCYFDTEPWPGPFAQRPRPAAK